MRVKILSYQAPPDAPPLAWLRERGCEVLVEPGWPGMSEDELIARVDGCDAVCCGTEPFTRRVIAALPRLKTIARTGVGFNSIDLDAAEEHGVVVTVTPGANRHAVADHAFGLLIMLARRIPQNQRMVAGGEWRRVVGRDVYGKTLGIVGVGNIGKEMARRAAGFRMDLLGHDIVLDETFAQGVGLRYVALDELLRCADFITLHVPRTAATYHLIGVEELALVRPTAHLINTARGGIVDEAALHAALVEGRLAGAALDVSEHEPDFASPLMQLDNVIWTPHVAGITDESRLACLAAACRNAWAVLSGEGRFDPVRPGDEG
ncbi:MAG: phosphoglycerate dehydrogenase [Armatimonadetes bacterium]|nr:phosphoglycerate dehydrogenase [Armatimonadota bacterium]